MTPVEILTLSCQRITALMGALPDGHHDLVVSAEIGAALADMSFWSLAGVIEADIDSTVDVSVVLSVALAGGNGGMVTRTSWDGTETVRGWRVTATDVEPLTEAQVFAAYCTDAMTGEPIPPEHGVRYAAGIPLT